MDNVNKLTAISLAVAAALPMMASADVMITEYVEGSSNNKAIELYNSGDTAIDLAGYKLVRYTPEKRQNATESIVEQTKHRNDGFTSSLIKKKLEECGYKCEITGLPMSEGKLAADHFQPKEQGGQSIESNCVILNKILNEKKNNHEPIEWFCKTLLTNFLVICKRVGGTEMLESCKSRIISFVNSFE